MTMTTLRILSLRAGCGALLAAALFGCERQNPVELADQRHSSASSRDAAVHDAVPAHGHDGQFYFVGSRPRHSVSPVAGPLWVPCAPPPTPCLHPVDLGTPFAFFGVLYSELRLYNNGSLSFGNPGTEDQNRLVFNLRGTVRVYRYAHVSDVAGERFIIHVNPARPDEQYVVLDRRSGAIEIHSPGDADARVRATHELRNQDGRLDIDLTIDRPDAVRFLPGRLPRLPVVIPDWSICSFSPGHCNPFLPDPRDRWVLVDIYDVSRFFPGQPNPDLVRIGSSWEFGTPAASFEILDINMDGNLDIQLRFDLQEAIRQGTVSPFSNRIGIWGHNPIDGRLFFGSAGVQWELPPQ
jgi:hypothetical protein